MVQISTIGQLYKSDQFENEYFLAIAIGETFAYGCAFYIGIDVPRLNPIRKLFGFKQQPIRIRIVSSEEKKNIERSTWTSVNSLDIIDKYPKRIIEYVNIMRSDIVESYNTYDDFWIVGQQYQKRFHLGHDERYTVLGVGKTTVFMRSMGYARVREVVLPKDKSSWVKK